MRFIIDDINQEWTFPSQSFDFIHVRGLAGCVEHWPSFLRQCYKYELCMPSNMTPANLLSHLKPGGRIEIADLSLHVLCDDDSFPEDCYLRTWEVSTDAATH